MVGECIEVQLSPLARVRRRRVVVMDGGWWGGCSEVQLDSRCEGTHAGRVVGDGWWGECAPDRKTASCSSQLASLSDY